MVTEKQKMWKNYICRIVFRKGGEAAVWNVNAIQKAMDYCIERDILKDILLSQKAEVLHMLLTEYNEKRHLKSEREQGMREGREAERKNTLREKLRADQEKQRAEEAEKLARQAESQLKELTARLEEYRKKYGADI